MHEDGGMMGQFVVSPNALSIKETQTISTNIYPIPATDLINIDLPERSSMVYIYDGLGKLMYSHQGINKLSMDVSSWMNGLYTVRIVQDQDVQTKRFTIAR